MLLCLYHRFSFGDIFPVIQVAHILLWYWSEESLLLDLFIFTDPARSGKIVVLGIPELLVPILSEYLFFFRWRIVTTSGHDKLFAQMELCICII